MSIESCNCIVCASEFNSDELESVALSKINVTRFKICQGCLNMCDPADDYRIAKDIINSYLKYAEAKTLFAEVSDIINKFKTK